MKIVHILTRLLRAGSEENTLLTAAGQMSRGHEVYLLHGRDVLPAFAERLAPGAKLIAAPSLIRSLNPARDWAAYHEIRRLLMEIQPDVVHTHQSKAGIIGRMAARSARVPLVVHGVHILPFLGVGWLQRAIYLWSERAAGKMTDGFIHVSEGMRRACSDNDVGPDQPHFVVPSGFDLTRFRKARPPVDWHTLLSVQRGEPRPFVIVMLAALEPRKRHLELLRQSAEFLHRFHQVRFVFAGEGHLRAEIESLIADLKLQRQVTLLGYRDDPERVIAMADVCVHTAEREGLPRGVLQYLAAGKPVVLLDLPGIEEIVSDGQNGFVVPQGDWSGFFDRLEMLISDPKQLIAMGKSARETPLDRWDAEYMAQRTLEIYQELRPDNPMQESVA